MDCAVIVGVRLGRLRLVLLFGMGMGRARWGIIRCVGDREGNCFRSTPYSDGLEKDMGDRDLSREELVALAEFAGQNPEEFGPNLPMLVNGPDGKGTTWKPHKDPGQANLIIEALRKQGWRGDIIWGVHAQDDDLPTTVRLYDMRPLDGIFRSNHDTPSVEFSARGWPLAVCGAALKTIIPH